MSKEFIPDPDNKEFQDALNLVRFSNQSFFLTGKAGTGKSTFIRYVCEHTRKKHVVLAPTGIAAINVGGVTLHSFFHLPLHLLLPDDPNFSLRHGKIFESLRYNRDTRKLINEVELIIIDEVSMVRCDIIDFIDKVLRVFCHKMRTPFGGKQVVMVGDVFQLEPVVQSDELEILHRFYPNAFFFSARVFQEMPLVSVELHKVYRQRDKAFISVLDRIRTNSITPTDLQLLNLRQTSKPSEGALCITLATRRDKVDFINDQHLRAIHDDPVRLKGKISGEFPKASLPTLEELELKRGAQVMLLHNDPDRRWVNGTLAKVKDFGQDYVRIETEDGQTHDVERVMWENVRYTYNEKEKKIEEQQLGTFTQYPLRLAWAITIHKSQGLTLNNVIVDLSGGAFAAGQTYVALSRCTSLEGIQLLEPVKFSDVFVRGEIIRFATSFNDQKRLTKALSQSKADIEYATTVKAFDAGDFQTALDHFFVAIHARYDIEKPLARRYIRRKLGVINRLRTQNRDLRQQLQEQRAMLAQLAEEYCQMGDECASAYDDAPSALANYDKALRLNPSSLRALVGKARLMLKTQPAKALPWAQRAVGVGATVETLLLRGECQLAAANTAAAKDDASLALDMDVESPEAHELMAAVLKHEGDEDQAAIHRAIAEELRKRKRG
ncbi:MAG: AAA family ATPase [Prevotella sp.]|nr:AAA family ATPase [Prevotella sp.]